MSTPFVLLCARLNGGPHTAQNHRVFDRLTRPGKADCANPARGGWSRKPCFAQKKTLALFADFEAARRRRASDTMLLYRNTDDLGKKRLGNEARFGVFSGRGG
jgi:hypothetical protein